MLVLSDQDIAKLLTMEDAIEAVENAFAQLRRGKVMMPTRSTIMFPKFNGSISFMPSYLEESGAQATKIISKSAAKESITMPREVKSRSE